ncbi:MAG: PBP1A family penicillin-binding protein [Desulfobacterales bacterium]|nr:PBP1A family penicillin-binding protein [Desulfobacterales bacterium]
MIKKIFIAAAAIFILLLSSILAYGWYLASHVDDRFSARRWSIPSKVYSDTFLLYPGQQINRQLFGHRLKRLGYRIISRQPQRKGEMQIYTGGIRLFLNDLKTPWRMRPGFLIDIEIDANTITSIFKSSTDERLSLLELEPEEITQFFGIKREVRQLVAINEVPQHFIQAVMAAEDNRFYSHGGIDPRGIARALMTNIVYGSIRQGGSTITQQLAKNYFLTPERTISRKLKEMILSVILELKYSKAEILEIYFNEIYLGQKGSISVNGVGEASYFYFGKSVSDLTLSESAVIAGLIKAPNIYSPYVDIKKCRSRRNDVLQAMHRLKWISAAQLNAQQKLNIKTVGFTDYGKKAPYFIDYLAQQLTSLYRPEDLTSLGLSIYTTMDTQVQIAAETSLKAGLIRLEQHNSMLQRKNPGRRLQGAVIVLQPKTGHILALVGGRNYGQSQFNRITQARRQPGSAFKPFVFATALDEFTPVTPLSNESQTYEVNGKPWQPKNFDPDAPERVTFRQALENSYNLATVDLAMQIGLEPIIDNAKRFGFSTPLKPFPSLALGAFEVEPLELARAYCVFAADGILPNPLPLKAVVDENDNMLAQRYLKVAQLISPAKAFMLSSLLQGVVTQGTARKLINYGINWPVAGKTGTSNDFRDAWFVGYTPDILALIWVGFDNGDSIYTTGSAAAMPIWANLVQKIPEHISGKAFRIPEGIETHSVCADAASQIGQQPCATKINEHFLASNMPTGLSPSKKGSGIFNRFFKSIKDAFKGS